ncbi:MAG: phosphohistidine phosphatase SixA [Bacteroidota bacterium]|jgi:phosphohistidine phosphatase
MNLYIVRHAIAVESGTPGYEDDSARPLTDAGSKKMKKIARGLHRLGVELDVILTSPYVRARDTAKILADRFDMMDKIFFTDNLIPPGNFESLVFEIHEKYDVANIALVGHEPMLSSLVSWLTTGDTGVRVTMKKGGVAYLSSDTLYQDGRATLEWLLTPSLMVQLSK